MQILEQTFNLIFPLYLNTDILQIFIDKKKAYQDSELSGREYERVVQYVNSILADENK